MRIFKQQTLYFILILFLAAGMLALAFHRNDPVRTEFWRVEIYADKAGYYIYLPSAFIYSFNSEAYPENIEEKCGYGFSLKEGVVRTKYPYGVSLLLAPFFLITHAIVSMSGGQADGFSRPYHWAVLISGAFFLFLGLWFSYKLLSKYFAAGISFLALFLLLTGTNLFWYASEDIGMSHVYSFALFAMLMYYYHQLVHLNHSGKRWLYFIIVAVLIALIAQVRNINLIFIPFVLLWDIRSFTSLRERIITFITWRNVLVFLLIFFVFSLPQLLYWKYSYGSYLVYSYQGETFSNWNEPFLAEMLFSPRSGIWVHNPLLVFVVIGGLWMLLREAKVRINAVLVLFVFVLYVYLYSSWGTWSLGTGEGSGSRAMVDLYPLLFFPVVWIMQHTRKWMRGVVLGLMILMMLYYQNLVLRPQPYNAISDWEWYYYKQNYYSGAFMRPLLGPNYYQEDPDMILTLKACNGNYVGVRPDGQLAAVSDSVTKNEMLNFIYVIRKDGSFAIKAANSYYVSADAFHQNLLLAQAEVRSYWETFFLVPQEKGKVAIQSHDGFYVSSEPVNEGILIANRTAILDWELFEADTLYLRE